MTDAGSPPLARSPRGLLLSAGAWGFVTGLAHLGLLASAQYMPTAGTGTGFVWRQMILYTSLLAFPIAPIGLLAFGFNWPGWGRHWVLPAALAFGIGYWGMASVEIATRGPHIGTLADALTPNWPILPGIVSAVAAVVWFGAHMLRRGAQSNVVQADMGSRPRYPWNWAVLPQSLRWAVAGLAMSVVIAAPLVYCARWNATMAPLRSKLAILHPSRYLGLPTPQPGDNPLGLGANGAFIPFAPGARRGLLVMVPFGKATLPAARIWLTELGPVGDAGGTPEFPLRVNPPVYCDLDQRQAERLFHDGLPTALLDAFRSAGAGSKPEVMWICTEDLGTPPPSAVCIDADACAR